MEDKHENFEDPKESEEQKEHKEDAKPLEE